MNEQHPERLVVVGEPVPGERVELAGLARRRQVFGPASRCGQEEKADNGRRSSEKDDGLQGVGPDDGLDAAEGRVEDGDAGRAEDYPLQRPVEHHGDGQGGGQQPDPAARDPRGEEHQRCRGPRPRAETLPEVFVDRRDGSTVERGEQQPQDQHSAEERSRVHLQVVPIALEGVGRDVDERQRADLGGDNRQPHDEPVLPSAAKEEIVRVPLAPPEPQAHRDDRGKVGSEY